MTRAGCAKSSSCNRPFRNQDAALISHTQYLANLIQAVAGNGDTAVDRRVEAEVIVSGIARDNRADTVQIDGVLPMAAHKRRRRKFFAKLTQPLYESVRFLAPGFNQRVIPSCFKIKDPVYLD